MQRGIRKRISYAPFLLDTGKEEYKYGQYGPKHPALPERKFQAVRH